MAKTMIENNQSGMTINRVLVRTMLVSVAGLIWSGGGTLALLLSPAGRLTSGPNENRERIATGRASSAQLDALI